MTLDFGAIMLQVQQVAPQAVDLSQHAMAAAAITSWLKNRAQQAWGGRGNVQPPQWFQDAAGILGGVIAGTAGALSAGLSLIDGRVIGALVPLALAGIGGAKMLSDSHNAAHPVPSVRPWLAGEPRCCENLDCAMNAHAADPLPAVAPAANNWREAR